MSARPAAVTRMELEALESAECLARQFTALQAGLEALADELRSHPPAFVLTCARGSSDHAASYGRFLVETHLGIPTGSLTPSTHSIYGRNLALERSLLVLISQSGSSPDLLSVARAARDAGARVIAFVNQEDSPLRPLAHHWIQLRAGEERAVAATKSYVCSLAALAHWVALWSRSAELHASLRACPEAVAQAAALDWRACVDLLAHCEHLFVMGRGPGLGLAQEAALKFKETCALHAEAFSTAEVQHGPMAILGPAVPALILAQQDQALEGQQALARQLIQRGVPVIFAGDAPAGTTALTTLPVNPVLAPIVHAVTLYRLIAATALARGQDPDRPAHLSKVTRTL